MKSSEHRITKKKRRMILKIAKSIYTMKQRNHKKRHSHLSKKIKILLDKFETYKTTCIEQEIQPIPET
jgi:predicted GTPase